MSDLFEPENDYETPEPSRDVLQQRNAIIGFLVAVVVVLVIILLVQNGDGDSEPVASQEETTAPVEEETAAEVPVEEAPVEEAPVEEAPVEEAAAEVPVEEVIVLCTPGKECGIEDIPAAVCEDYSYFIGMPIEDAVQILTAAGLIAGYRGGDDWVGNRIAGESHFEVSDQSFLLLKNDPHRTYEYDGIPAGTVREVSQNEDCSPVQVTYSPWNPVWIVLSVSLGEHPTEETNEDIGPPEPPVNVTCGPGGGSTEFYLKWDAPAEPDDIHGINVYISENGGAYNRGLQELISEGVVAIDLDGGTRWGIVISPVPADTPLMLAVTSFDVDYNESGWWPIEAYYGSGLDCFTGPPDAPNIGIISPGAGSGETDIKILPNGSDPAPAEDIISYTVLVDTGSGFQEVPIISQSFKSSFSGYLLIVSPNDHAPADYQITATDAHGNVSATATQSCPDSSTQECN